MNQIIAAVPNICEGADQAFIDGLGERLSAIPGLIMLDVAMDNVRNRTVFSFTGSKDAVFGGGLALYEAALGHIDMRRHVGEFPRVGAVDVFPFVPLKDASMDEAKAWAVEFAEAVAERFKLPVYLYAESARYRYRRDLDNIRQGEYEGFEAKMTDQRWKPDLGPDRFSATAGVTIIGARYPLLSFNVFLGSRDETIAHAVAHALASTSGGVVRAHGALDHASDRAMLSVAITNFKASPLYRVVENIRIEAARFGVDIRHIDLIGLVPERVLIEAAEYYLRIRNFDHEDLLERNIQRHLDRSFTFGG
ncbi:MAG: glutamate formimidoyltransferase [Thermoanaerobaculales bacterium]|jgi:glutamate formiminotransferase|nr:glutamate formimidoyltransferase [Thermoanaerobaculales bacterium]